LEEVKEGKEFFHFSLGHNSSESISDDSEGEDQKVDSAQHVDKPADIHQLA